MSDNLNLWLALDPANGLVRLVLNGHTVGRLTTENGNPRIKLDGEYREQFAAVEPYANALFAGMGETLSAAVFEAGSFRVNQAGRPQAQSISPARRTQIHLGCGPDEREGWLNIDYRPGATLGYDPTRNFLNYDLRSGLPLPDASAELIFSSHFFEHLRHEHATQLMRECRRVLKPGGRARFQMPDYESAFAGYIRRDPEGLRSAIETHGLLNHMPAYARAWGDLISRAVYEFYEHKYIWDTENLPIALQAAGFASAAVTGPVEGLDNLSDARKDVSFYVEATA
jgi:predicted SAM-dependent methyltransferase